MQADRDYAMKLYFEAGEALQEAERTRPGELYRVEYARLRCTETAKKRADNALAYAKELLKEAE
eukprot:scaffold675680_cov67-Prasinocladus_malaysianus.AAC.1